MNLNARAAGLVERLIARAEERRVAVIPVEGGGRVIDCGVTARGGLSAGLGLRGAPSLIQLRAQRIADGKWGRPPRRRGRLACVALAATATACTPLN